MIFAWGKYALVHPAQGEAERCTFCEQPAVDRRVVERTFHVLLGPLVPLAFQSLTRCSHCKQLRVEPLPAGPRPRRRMFPRLAITWAIVALAAITGIVGTVWARGVVRGRAEHPAIGDEWTIDTHQWSGLGGAMRYGRIRIKDVTDGKLAAAACDYTSDDDRTIEEKCRAYPIELPTLLASDVPGYLDDGRIVTIWRHGADPREAMFAILGGLILAWIVHGLLARRAVRRAAKAGPDLPAARVTR